MIVPRTAPDSDEVAGHYDELDRVYREIWGEHVHHGYWETGRESSKEAVEALADLVGRKLAPEAGEHLADIGCGYGATAARFAEQYAVVCTGFTISGEQHKRASARPGPLVFQLQDWLTNGCADGAFDGAYAIESTEHMGDKQLFFDQAHRTIRPGGRLVVCAWLAAAQPRAWEIDHLLEPICREGRLPGMGTREDYRAMASQAGFDEQAFEDISSRVRRTWTICLVRLARKMVSDLSYWRLLLNPRTRNRTFVLSLPRLVAAYRTGAMRYGLFTFVRR